mgnify:CR=1 FL=1
MSNLIQGARAAMREGREPTDAEEAAMEAEIWQRLCPALREARDGKKRPTKEDRVSVYEMPTMSYSEIFGERR